MREPLTGHDEVATDAARTALLQTLQSLAAQPHFALGHEDSAAYGVGWIGEHGRSDVHSVCGSHPGVLGWDAFGIEHGDAHNGDGVPFDAMRKWIVEGYHAGSINTISWHAHNPITQGNAWETNRVIQKILPGRERHADWVRYLDRLANYLQSIRGPKRELVPLILRPFHEHTGSWFWWGKAHASEADYIALWRFTVDYLRNERGLSNLLFAFSPSGGDVHSEQAYLYGYPGDDYVDVLGVDHYYRLDSARFVRVVELVVDLANKRGKVAAVTEFGAQGGLNDPAVSDRDWMSKSFLEPLLASPSALRISYALAWRNARVDHCFLPYPGHPFASQFKQFCERPEVLLQNDLKRLSGPSNP